MAALAAEHPVFRNSVRNRLVITATLLIAVLLFVFAILGARGVMSETYDVRTTATKDSSGNNSAVDYMNSTVVARNVISKEYGIQTTAGTAASAVADKRDNTCNILDVLNPIPGVVDVTCNCYDGAAIPKDDLDEVVGQYCDSTSEVTWGGSVGWTAPKAEVFWYNNALGGTSAILVLQTWWADKLGTEEICGPEFAVSVDQCKSSFGVVVGGCYKNSQNQLGGQGHDACLLWTVDADPEHNNPDVYSTLVPPAARLATRTAAPVAEKTAANTWMA